MNEIITKRPVGIAVELAGWNTTDTDIWAAFVFLLAIFSPGNANFRRKFSDVFVILKIGPKFNLGARLLA